MVTSSISPSRTVTHETTAPPRNRIISMPGEVDFIPNDSFPEADRSVADQQALETSNRVPVLDANAKSIDDLPPHLAALCEASLLSADEERELFRSMNYLKFRVCELQREVAEHGPSPETLAHMQSLYSGALSVRDQIVRANMRLVISIVKKFVTSSYSFDELLSEGIDTILQAVEKFDFARGFRFSTYAYRSIARHVYRRISERQKESNRIACGVDDLASELPEAEQNQLFNESSWYEFKRMLAKLLQKLDKRERFIVEARYGMNEDGKVKTFQSVADKLGVSKERVRQIEKRAVEKLRTMAVELGMTDLLGSAFQVEPT